MSLIFFYGLVTFCEPKIIVSLSLSEISHFRGGTCKLVLFNVQERLIRVTFISHHLDFGFDIMRR